MKKNVPSLVSNFSHLFSTNDTGSPQQYTNVTSEVPSKLEEALSARSPFWQFQHILVSNPDYKNEKYLSYYLKILGAKSLHYYHYKKPLIDFYPHPTLLKTVLLNNMAGHFDTNIFKQILSNKEFIESEGEEFIRQLQKKSRGHEIEQIYDEIIKSRLFTVNQIVGLLVEAKKNRNFIFCYFNQTYSQLKGYPGFNPDTHRLRLM